MKCGQQFLIAGRDLSCYLELGHGGTCKAVLPQAGKGSYRIVNSDTTEPSPVAKGKTLMEVFASEEKKKAVGGSWRTATAIPTTTRGRKFPSKVQAATFDDLCEQAIRDKEIGIETIILHEVPIELPAFDIDGSAPVKWRVDFMVLRGRLGVWSITIYEAKGSKSAESRDFRLRLRAFIKTYPWKVYICRKKGDGIYMEDGREMLLGRGSD
jgi:hypothetical protein